MWRFLSDMHNGKGGVMRVYSAIVVVSALFVVITGCRERPTIVVGQPVEATANTPCPARPATHILICGPHYPRYEVYRNGGYVCISEGGEIEILGAPCLLVPLRSLNS